MEESVIKKTIRESYAKIARKGESCCPPTASSCCGGQELTTAVSRRIGYSEEEIRAVPDGANLGLGCGNPIALASLKEGEVVLDLGAGAGFDCFLAAAKVGEKGRVIGVDMTPEMIEKARENARKDGRGNVEFRLGEIEHLPVADATVDVIISNCVINLVPDKKQAFQEAFRVLKPGGRAVISDIVLLRPLADFIMNSIAAYIGCVSGAVTKDDYLGVMREAGFQEVRILEETTFSIDCLVSDPTARAIMESLNMTQEEVAKTMESAVSSIRVQAIKP
ncbi:MAG: arsenite methyltransferase [Syntrophales bacterium]